MQKKVSRAIILAAGLGLRMRPLTLTKPKPLIEVAGRSLLDRALDLCMAWQIQHVAVNAAYKKEMIVTHLAQRSEPSITLSLEDEPLETGGGISKALPLLGNHPFFALNSDTILLDPEGNSMRQMCDLFQHEKLLGVLLVIPVQRAIDFLHVPMVQCLRDDTG